MTPPGTRRIHPGSFQNIDVADNNEKNTSRKLPEHRWRIQQREEYIQAMRPVVHTTSGSALKPLAPRWIHRTLLNTLCIFYDPRGVAQNKIYFYWVLKLLSSFKLLSFLKFLSFLIFILKILSFFWKFWCFFKFWKFWFFWKFGVFLKIWSFFLKVFYFIIFLNFIYFWKFWGFLKILSLLRK